MKIFKKLVFMVCVLVLEVAGLCLGKAELKVWAEEYYRSEDGFSYYTDDGKTATITGYSGNETELEIPENIDGLVVTGIDINGYDSSFEPITSVIIPNTVIDIRFMYCTGLKSIDIPSSITSINDVAFLGCTSLETICIPDSIEVIGFGAFDGCTSLESINIPDSVTSIGDSAFHDCTALESINIPSSVMCIGINAFRNCTSLESINIPGGITNLYYSFVNCTSLQNVSISSGVTEIGSYAFMGCTALKSVNIPDSVISIGMRAFSNCTALESIDIPDSVREIGENAFSGCHLLKDVKIPKASIYAYAFYDCPLLKSVTFTKNTVIYSNFDDHHYYSFGYCDEGKVEGFTIYGYAGSSAEAYAAVNGFNFVNIGAPEETESPDDSVSIGVTGDFLPRFEITKDKILAILSKLFTKEQLEAIKAGINAVDVSLIVSDISESVSKEDKELIDKEIENISDNERLGFRAIKYLDIKLGVLVGDKRINVTETDGEAAISVEIENPANGTYKVVRVHDGKTDVIDSILSGDGKRLTFRTDRFSTYAIVYADVAGGSEVPIIFVAAFLSAGLAAMAVGAAVMIKAFKSAEDNLS